MTGLIRSWKESCAVFVPKNFKLFFLAVLNTFVQSLVPFLLYVGFFLVILTIIGAFLSLIFMRPLMLQGSFGLLIIGVLIPLSKFGMYLSVRPSVSSKNVKYFFGFGFHFIWFVLFNALFSVIDYGLIMFIGKKGQVWIDGLLITPLMIFLLFFLFDSRPSIMQQFRNLKSAVMFVIYNLPFCLISGAILFVLLHYITVAAVTFVPYSILIPASLFFITGIVSLFTISWFCVMYTKRVYEQYELYK